MNGYFKADQKSLAIGLVGLFVGAAIASRTGKKSKGKKSNRLLVGSALGVGSALAARAWLDPDLEAERKQLKG